MYIPRLAPATSAFIVSGMQTGRAQYVAYLLLRLMFYPVWKSRNFYPIYASIYYYNMGHNPAGYASRGGAVRNLLYLPPRVQPAAPSFFWGGFSQPCLLYISYLIASLPFCRVILLIGGTPGGLAIGPCTQE